MVANSQIPLWAAVHLTHAALQAVAESANADILHIKGPTDAVLREQRHDSADADVLVRPAHVDAFVDELERLGWSVFAGFEEGSPFGHAANFSHSKWTLADVHRSIPGFRTDADTVFERLWRDRQIIQIAHRPCATPSPAAQILIQVMHVARSHGADQPETWAVATDDLRSSARSLTGELGGEVAFAAGIGELDGYRDAPDYLLWKHWSQEDDNRATEWIARVRAAPGLKAKLETIVKATRVNRTRLRMRLGHEPDRREIRDERRARIRHAMSSGYAAAKAAIKGRF